MKNDLLVKVCGIYFIFFSGMIFNVGGFFPVMFLLISLLMMAVSAIASIGILFKKKWAPAFGAVIAAIFVFYGWWLFLAALAFGTAAFGDMPGYVSLKNLMHFFILLIVIPEIFMTFYLILFSQKWVKELFEPFKPGAFTNLNIQSND